MTHAKPCYQAQSAHAARLQVTGVFARRGYNVQSLAVGNSEVEGQSRITMVIPGSADGTSKIVKQLNKLVHVQQARAPAGPAMPVDACLCTVCAGCPWLGKGTAQLVPCRHARRVRSHAPHAQVHDLSDRPFVARELMLIKVRCSAEKRRELSDLADIFHGSVCDVSLDTITLEIQGKEDKMHALQGLLEPYGERATFPRACAQVPFIAGASKVNVTSIQPPGLRRCHACMVVAFAHMRCHMCKAQPL